VAQTGTTGATETYERVIKGLRRSYNRKAKERDGYEISTWKIEERDNFLSLLQKENKQRLLEIGAGTGQHGKFFQDHGLQVICTDLSEEMVEFCRAKGLTAHAMDFMSLDFPDCSFDAVFALNCLLHVPNKDLHPVLGTIRALLKPSGLFYLGLYGGREYEGTWPEDKYRPKRFFSFHTDEQIREIVSGCFRLLVFRRIPLDGESDLHFQSMILRRG
jgi:SAM-dependent methyltransferase